jgi:hypothetical protein
MLRRRWKRDDDLVTTLGGRKHVLSGVRNQEAIVQCVQRREQNLTIPPIQEEHLAFAVPERAEELGFHTEWRRNEHIVWEEKQTKVVSDFDLFNRLTLLPWGVHNTVSMELYCEWSNSLFIGLIKKSLTRH